MLRNTNFVTAAFRSGRISQIFDWVTLNGMRFIFSIPRYGNYFSPPLLEVPVPRGTRDFGNSPAGNTRDKAFSLFFSAALALRSLLCNWQQSSAG
jgi:hypothetical protein